MELNNILETTIKILKNAYHLPRKVGGFLIRIYQKTLSPDHGWLKVFYPYGYCKFTPSCSEYAHQAVMKRGLIIGVLKAAWRILRCNPWSKGGDDPVR